MQAIEFSSYLYDSHRIDIPNNVQIKPNQNIRVMVLIDDVPKIEAKKKRQLGIMKGEFSISDDFDEPLDDLKEYMY
ncbi:MAG: DUF2281 domain-containing protein [Bacteroidota bacterium]